MTATLLTGPDQKEGLSLAYVKALLARAVFSTPVPEPDRDSGGVVASQLVNSDKEKLVHRDLMAVVVTVLALSAPLAAQEQAPGTLPPGSIWVVTEAGPDATASRAPASVSGSPQQRHAWSDIASPKLAENMGDVAQHLKTVMDSIGSALGDYDLTQIEVSLVIRADGSVGILGTGGTVGASGGIKLVLRR